MHVNGEIRKQTTQYNSLETVIAYNAKCFVMIKIRIAIAKVAFSKVKKIPNLIQDSGDRMR